MPVERGWYDENQNIYYIKLAGHWSLEEYYDMLKDARKATTTINYPFATFVDLTESYAPPAQFLSTGHHSSKDNAEPVVTVMVGLNRFNEIILNMFQRFFPKAVINIRTANSIEEGLKMAQDALKKAETRRKTDSSTG